MTDFLTAALRWLSTPREGAMLAVFIIGALFVGAAALALLASTPPRYRKGIVAGITFVAGLYLSLEFLLPPGVFWFTTPPGTQLLTKWQPIVAIAVQIIWSFALLLGVWNLFQIHGRAVRKQASGWYNSAAFFVMFAAILTAGLAKDAYQNNEIAEAAFSILFRGFLTSMEATMFSLIAFYIVSAAYRAFRVRSTESVLMMVAAAVIMLALVPVGAVITDWLPHSGFLSMFRLERIGYWILVWPNMAAQRAIGFGISVGALAMGLRIWLSLERGSFFDRRL